MRRPDISTRILYEVLWDDAAFSLRDTEHDEAADRLFHTNPYRAAGHMFCFMCYEASYPGDNDMCIACGHVMVKPYHASSEVAR